MAIILTKRPFSSLIMSVPVSLQQRGTAADDDLSRAIFASIPPRGPFTQIA